jgi:hypothetical protein
LEPSDDKKYFIKAISKNNNLDPGQAVVLRPKFEKYELRNGNSLLWAGIWFGCGCLFFFIALAWPGVEIVKNRKAKRDDLSYTEIVNMLIP